MLSKQNSELCPRLARGAIYILLLIFRSSLLLKLRNFKVYGCFMLLCFRGAAVHTRMKTLIPLKNQWKIPHCLSHGMRSSVFKGLLLVAHLRSPGQHTWQFWEMGRSRSSISLPGQELCTDVQDHSVGKQIPPKLRDGVWPSQNWEQKTKGIFKLRFPRLSEKKLGLFSTTEHLFLLKGRKLFQL